MSEAKSEQPAIHAALIEVMKQVRSVGKDSTNTFQKFSFRGIDDVLNAVGPALRDCGVSVRPVVRDVIYQTVATSQNKQSTACRITADYVFTAVDGSEVVSTVIAESWDTGDKAAPKAMSVAMRTALIQTLALPTDEPDPDSFTHERVAAPAAQGFDPQQALQQAWGSLDALRGLHAHAAQIGAPAEYLQQIQTRINELGAIQNGK